jgi:hypothetical protein
MEASIAADVQWTHRIHPVFRHITKRWTIFLTELGYYACIVRKRQLQVLLITMSVC